MPKKELPAYYPLTLELSQKLRGANLTAAEWRFWAYITEIDPWGDRYKDLSPLTIMTECGMIKPTYYRAKAKFQELGIFDFQEEKVSVRNLMGISSLKQSQKFNSESQKFNSESPEPLLCKGSKTSQTLQTYSDLKDSLTLKTRESFEKFCFKKIEECSFKIASPQSWLNKHYLEYWEEFSRKHPEAAGVEKSSATAQPVEFMTTEHLRQMYGADWKATAAHFGIEVSDVS